jgi:dienelactone hydrolase
MFHFFAGNYMWSQAVLRLFFTGGSPGEVLRGAEELRAGAAVADQEEWYRVWRATAERLHQRSDEQSARRFPVSARSTSLSACSFYQWAVAFMRHDDPRRRECHELSLRMFDRYGRLSDPAIERVEVPYEGGAFPAWFVPGAARDTSSPVAIYLPGWDSTKEQGIELAVALAERGISTLLCDGPGIGEAVMFRDLPNRHDYEVPGSAAVDYLMTRTDIDDRRIVVVGSSLGGYRAARFAAFDGRLAAAVVWGAMWDFHRTWVAWRQSGKVAATPSYHALHVMGAENLEQVEQMLEAWTLEGVAGQITCPLLVLHGQDDVQIPAADARALLDAAGSAEKELKIFTAEEGGAAHCQNDNRLLAHDYIGDWLQERLFPAA